MVKKRKKLLRFKKDEEVKVGGLLTAVITYPIKYGKVIKDKGGAIIIAFAKGKIILKLPRKLVTRKRKYHEIK